MNDDYPTVPQGTVPTTPLPDLEQPRQPLVPYVPNAQPAVPPAPSPTYAYQPTVYPHAAAPTPRVGGVHIAIAWIFAVVTLGYMLPWAVAATRQKSNTLAIGLLNFFVGWTLIGWIASLVMACMAEPAHVTNIAYAGVSYAPNPGPLPPPGWYPDGAGRQRYWDGRSWTNHIA